VILRVVCRRTDNRARPGADRRTDRSGHDRTSSRTDGGSGPGVRAATGDEARRDRRDYQ